MKGQTMCRALQATVKTGLGNCGMLYLHFRVFILATVLSMRELG